MLGNLKMDNCGKTTLIGQVAHWGADYSLEKAAKELDWKAENGIKEMCEDSWRW